LTAVGVSRRNRVKPAFAEWLATRQALDSQPASPEDAVDFERLHGVFRATRMETAMLPEQWADEAFVQAQQRYQYSTHEGAYLKEITISGSGSSRAGKDSGIRAC